MYYHTCPTAGRIWTRTNAVTASPASVGNPQSGTAWTACGRGGARGPAVSALKLGSLFDGIGVFPLAASAVALSRVGQRDRQSAGIHHQAAFP